jgi:hypothetical protein
MLNRRRCLRRWRFRQEIETLRAHKLFWNINTSNLYNFSYHLIRIIIRLHSSRLIYLYVRSSKCVYIYKIFTNCCHIRQEILKENRIFGNSIWIFVHPSALVKLYILYINWIDWNMVEMYYIVIRWWCLKHVHAQLKMHDHVSDISL